MSEPRGEENQKKDLSLEQRVDLEIFLKALKRVGASIPREQLEAEIMEDIQQLFPDKAEEMIGRFRKIIERNRTTDHPKGAVDRLHEQRQENNTEREK